VRPTLGSAGPRIALLGGVYAIASASLDVASNTSRLDEADPLTRLMLILPVGLLDTLYFWWCASAISRTLSQLSSRRQSAKLLLYRRFSHVLLLLLLASGAWILWQMGLILAGALDTRWNLLWTFDAFWHVLYFGVLAAICALWSPSKNNLQYAYYDESVQDLEDADAAEDLDSTSADGTSVAPYKRGA